METFSVYVEVSGRNVLDGHYAEHDTAIRRANYLFNLGKYNIIRVSHNPGDNQRRVILEKRFGDGAKAAVLNDVSRIFVCTVYLDAYSFSSRLALSRMLRNYFDEKVIIPSELLHNATLLKDYAFNDRLLQATLTKLARAQCEESKEDITARRDRLQKIFQDLITASERSTELTSLHTKFLAQNFSDFIDDINAEQPGETHDRILTYVIARELKGIDDFGRKVARLAKLYDDAQSCFASQTLDEFLAETIDATMTIKSLIGASIDLGSALILLAQTYHGVLADARTGTEALRLLNGVVRRNNPQLVRAAIAARISASLLGATPLTKRGRAEDRPVFQALVKILQGQTLFVGDSAMSKALTIRAKTLFGTPRLDLPFDAAIDTVCDMLPTREQRFDYVFSLLFSDLAPKLGPVLAEKIIEAFQALTPDDLRSLTNRLSTDDANRQAILNRLSPTAVPADVLHHIFPADGQEPAADHGRITEVREGRMPIGAAFTLARPYMAVLTAVLGLLATGGTADLAHAGGARLKDIVDIEGIRDNPVIGYGLVVGLNGTGDDDETKVPYRGHAIRNMLERMGVSVGPGGINTPNSQKIDVKNVAAVMVTGTLPGFAAPGTRIDVQVASMGTAKSLLGGVLLITPLLAADGEVYAVAQGSVSIAGYSATGKSEGNVTVGVPTSGRIPSGAIVEREIPFALAELPVIRMSLRNPDLTTARRIAHAVNGQLRQNAASVTDPSTVMVKIPSDRQGEIVEVLTDIENLIVEPDNRARVIVDERTGAIVMGENVRISTVAVSLGSLTLRITETPQVSQPNAFTGNNNGTIISNSNSTATNVNNAGGVSTVTVQRSDIQADTSSDRRLAVMPSGISIGEVVQNLNALGVGPRDMITLLQAIKASGAMQAEIGGM